MNALQFCVALMPERGKHLIPIVSLRAIFDKDSSVADLLLSQDSKSWLHQNALERVCDEVNRRIENEAREMLLPFIREQTCWMFKMMRREESAASRIQQVHVSRELLVPHISYEPVRNRVPPRKNLFGKLYVTLDFCQFSSHYRFSSNVLLVIIVLFFSCTALLVTIFLKCFACHNVLLDTFICAIFTCFVENVALLWLLFAVTGHAESQGEINESTFERRNKQKNNGKRGEDPGGAKDIALLANHLPVVRVSVQFGAWNLGHCGCCAEQCEQFKRMSSRHDPQVNFRKRIF